VKLKKIGKIGLGSNGLTRIRFIFLFKNKPDPALVQTSYPSYEIKKRIPKSRETIPLEQTEIIRNIFGYDNGGKMSITLAQNTARMTMNVHLKHNVK
jgi:hypothetical protein